MDATVVIPTFNRRGQLLATLETLARQDYPLGRWEAIVVDDGSDDGTGEAVAGLGPPFRVLRQANAGPAAARNRGAAAACGRMLVFIDDDVSVPVDFLTLHLQALAARPGAWIMGRVVHPPELRQTPFGRYRDWLWEAFHRAHGCSGITETGVLTAANLSLERSDFEALGGFDEGFTIASGEDWDLGLRARRRGIHILYHPGIVVVHNDWAVDLQRFCERQRLYSISDVRLWRKYGDESPRARLVRESSPVDWRGDRPRLIVKKLLKRTLATWPGRALIHGVSRVSERIAPESWCRRTYDVAVGVAIFRGVREGLRRYPPSA